MSYSFLGRIYSQKQVNKLNENKIMTFNNKTMQEVSPYETPTVTTLEVLSEGVLCGSFDDPSYGYDDDNDLGEI